MPLSVKGTGLKAFILAAVILFFAMPLASASSVTRSFSKSTGIRPGEVISVSLFADFTGGETYLLMDETLPPGWGVTDPGPEGSAAIPGHVRWAIYGTNPLPSTTYSYMIRAPSRGGMHTFSGEYVFEGMAAEGVIGGESQVQVSMPLAEFSVHDIQMDIGNSMLLKIYVNNPDQRFANISVWLGGDYPQDLAKFSYDSAACFTPDYRNVTLSLNPAESAVMRIIIYSTGPKPGGEPYTITLNANTTASSLTQFDRVNVYIGYEPQFPGLEPWGIILILALSGLAYWKMQNKKYSGSWI